jgi:uncharacterized membrane protein
MVFPDWIFFLALAGFLDGLYFTFAYYGRVRRMPWVPEALCAREGSSCVTVVKTPDACLFGVPNSLLGLVYYFLLMLWSLLGCPIGFEVEIAGAYRIFRIGWLVTSVSAIAALLGFYLVYALRRKLHVNCLLCYTAHAINLALFVLVIVQLRR